MGMVTAVVDAAAPGVVLAVLPPEVLAVVVALAASLESLPQLDAPKANRLTATTATRRERVRGVWRYTNTPATVHPRVG
jgi:hypothetical protein